MKTCRQVYRVPGDSIYLLEFSLDNIFSSYYSLDPRQLSSVLRMSLYEKPSDRLSVKIMPTVYRARQVPRPFIGQP